MSALTVVEGLGAADHCELEKFHVPKPLRYVFHHKLPLVCGGLTKPDNLIQICDCTHYAVHIIMYILRINRGELPSKVGTKKQRGLALEGYQLAVQAGTVDKIPKEA